MAWQMKNLGDVCKVTAGQSPQGKYYNKVGEGLPFYQGKKDFGEKYIMHSGVWSSAITKEAYPGDILMSVRAPVGPINFTNRHICIGRGLAAISPSADIDRDYLFYYLLGARDKIQGKDGAVFASINKQEINELEIAVTGISEQKKIVARACPDFCVTAIFRLIRLTGLQTQS